MRPVHLPSNLEELWEILSGDPESTLYAGGTDLFIRMRKGIVSPSSLVCLERIGELRGVREVGDRVFLGACTTFSSLLSNPVILSHFPILAKALAVLGSPHIRNMGTIGGNIVTASPAGDTLPPLYLLGAEIEIRSKASQRRIPIRDFIRGPGKVDLSPREILCGVWLRKGRNYSVNLFEKVGGRNALAIAVVSLGALVDVSEEGVVEDARFAWGSVGPTVVTSRVVESFMVGKSLDMETLSRAAFLAREAVSPIDDVRATASYRREVAGNLLFRLLELKREK